MERNTGQEGGRREGGVGLRERDEKKELGKKYHLFFRHGEDKNVSCAQKQSVSIGLGCERCLCTGWRRWGGLRARRGKGERAEREGGRQMGDREMREAERVGESRGGERGAETGSGSGVNALGTLTSGGDMTRHAGSAQLGQRSALPCCFGLALPPPNTHTHTCTERLPN